MDKIITISREYGSGGRVIGKAVAEKLGVPFYDREIIELSAQKSGLAVSFVEDTEQKIKNKFLHNLAFGGRYMGVDPAVSGLSLSDKLFIATCDIIREIADRGPCVIVGRCADYILKDRPNMFDVFVYADDEHKANRIAMRNDMALDKALGEVKPIRARVEFEDQVLELDVLDGLVCSTTSVGGVLALDSLGISLNDGQSELLLVRDIKNLIDFNNVSTALLKSDFRENENIVSKKVRRVKFLFDSPVDWTLDGEYGGTVKEVEIVNHQRAVNIIVPR